MKAIYFVTGNLNKLREAEEILGFKLQHTDLNLPEYQGDPDFVVKEKARMACEKLKKTVFVDDVSLCFSALNGLPGHYIKDFLEKLGRDGVYSLLAAHKDKSATAVLRIGYCEPEKEPLVFIGEIKGKIVKLRGETNFGWDPLFQPDGYKKTFAEMTAEQKNAISHRKRALDKFRGYLKKNKRI